MMGASYKTKRALRESIGQPLNYIETSIFDPEYKDDGVLYVVGPDPYKNRMWYAQVTMKEGLIASVK